MYTLLVLFVWRTRTKINPNKSLLLEPTSQSVLLCSRTNVVGFYLYVIQK